jgi:hypothetical protein
MQKPKTPKKPSTREAAKPKKSKEEADAKNPYRDSDGFICVTGALLWKWRALDAELRAWQAELDVIAGLIQAEMAKNAKLSELFQRKSALVGNVSVAKGELLSAQGEIEKEIGISLRECAFDDKTGRIYALNENGDRGDPVS